MNFVSLHLPFRYIDWSFLRIRRNWQQWHQRLTKVITKIPKISGTKMFFPQRFELHIFGCQSTTLLLKLLGIHALLILVKSSKSKKGKPPSSFNLGLWDEMIPPEKTFWLLEFFIIIKEITLWQYLQICVFVKNSTQPPTGTALQSKQWNYRSLNSSGFSSLLSHNLLLPYNLSFLFGQFPLSLQNSLLLENPTDK